MDLVSQLASSGLELLDVELKVDNSVVNESELLVEVGEVTHLVSTVASELTESYGLLFDELLSISSLGEEDLVDLSFDLCDFSLEFLSHAVEIVHSRFVTILDVSTVSGAVDLDNELVALVENVSNSP